MEQCQNTSIASLFVLLSHSRGSWPEEVEHEQVTRLRYHQSGEETERCGVTQHCSSGDLQLGKVPCAVWMQHVVSWVMLHLLETENSTSASSFWHKDPRSPSPYLSWCWQHLSDKQSRCWNICAERTAVGSHTARTDHINNGHICSDVFCQIRGVMPGCH